MPSPSESTDVATRRPWRLLLSGLVCALLVPVLGPAVSASATPTAPVAVALPATRVAAAAAPLPAFDIDSLDPEPVQQWGVVGTGLTLTVPKPHVWDFAEIGSTIYVAGTFTGVQRNGFDPTSVVEPQAYVAAFDRDTGAWIPTFNPTVNRTVYTIEATPAGQLLIGGEFDTVNGETRRGLALLDATSGDTVSSFTTEVARSSGQAIVREIVIDGNDMYVVGEFNYIVLAGSQHWIWNAVRLRTSTGQLDPSWLPQFAGSVWDLAIDGSRGRIHVAGFFTSANAQPGTARFATVSQTDGSSIAGVTPLTFNTNGQQDTVAVAYADDAIYVGGAQHVLQVLDPVTNAQLGFSDTGLNCDTFNASGCGFVAGGDMQTLEVTASGEVLAGCHCFRSTEGGWNNPSWLGRTHYSSFTGQRTDHRVAIAYDTTTHAPASPFVPGLAANYYGTYALHVDANGCLYVGGYYTRSESGQWVGGFGRFCQPVASPTDLVASTGNQTVRLDWTAPDSQLPVVKYKVYQDGVFLGDTTGLTYSVGGLTAGSAPVFTVETVDASGRRSTASQVSITVAGPDVTPPAAPGSVAATAAGADVTVTWAAAVDDQGVREYLVHRDYQFVAVLAPTQLSFLDLGVANGPHRYDIRARDLAGHLSEPGTATVTVGAADTLAPTIPQGVIGTSAGSSVTLTWAASTDQPNPGGTGVAGYLIHDNWQFLAWVPSGTTYTHVGAANGMHRYHVRAQDAAGNNSGPSTLVQVWVGPADPEAPTTPAGVTATVAGSSVTLSWSASADLPNPGGSGVTGYLVHRDWQFVAWVPAGTSFVDTSVPAGQHRYEIRAQDGAGNNSTPSQPLIVSVN